MKSFYKLFAVAALALAAPAHAGSQADEKFKNGQPFATLAAEIESQTVQIDALAATTSALESDLSALAVDVALLSVTVTDNTGHLAALRTEVATLSEALELGLVGLATLTDEYRSLLGDAALNDARITEVKSQIADLDAKVQSELASLRGKVDQLRAEIEADRAAIDALSAHTSALEERTNAELAASDALLKSLAEQLSVVDTLVDQSALNAKMVTELEKRAQLEYALQATKHDLDTLRNEFATHVHEYEDHFQELQTQQYLYTYWTYEWHYVYLYSYQSCSGSWFWRECWWTPVYGWQQYPVQRSEWRTQTIAIARMIVRLTSTPN